MNILLLMMILVPATGLLVSLLLPGKSEVLISRTVFLTVGLSFLVSLSLFVTWLCLSAPVIDFKELVLYKNSNYEYFIDFHFDEISAVYALVGSLLTFLIAVYSRVYLHRENGYKRFFNTILFCYLGYNLIIFSGNLETLFIGWEFLGIASFLLIAFYRDRYLPVRNAVKVYSVYRLGDVGLLLAMWLIHHLFHGNIIFNTLDNPAIVHAHLAGNEWAGPAIAGLLLLVALVKSAQFPFTSWLPRAMEGPTPSSAIFYGSLSVHLGVFILLRTFHFWEDQISVRILIGSFGLLTAIASTGIARVQSSVKTQIAYSSAAQIGLIFIEVALGLKWVALMHFAGNAFFGTYKLLVSPSVVSYLIREQFYNFKPRQRTLEDSLPKRLSYGFYMLCLKEWHLDTMVHRLYRMPIKRLGNLLMFMNGWQMLGVFGLLFVGGIVLRLFESSIPMPN
jgi:NADH-quinone oxidoreductase subunit L